MSVNSAVALAINEVMRERNRTFIATNVGTSDLTGKFCAPTTVQWTIDTWALGNAAARALTQEGGNKLVFHLVRLCAGRGAGARCDRRC